MSLQKIVITGVNGFVGKHLVGELNKNNIQVIGVDRAEQPEAEIANQLIGYFSADLVEKWPVNEEVSCVIHLAGLAAVGPSFDHPQDYININSAIMTNIAESYLESTAKPRLLVISSGAIYDPDQAMPLTEASLIGYTSPYSVSKVLVENQCAYYRSRGLDCITARPFNHIGPGQKAGFLLPDLYEQIQENPNKLVVGDLSTKRDFTDVRDVVRAYLLLATKSSLKNTIYNVCSGKSVSGNEILQKLQKAANTDIKVIVDEKKIRPNDPKDVFGDNSRLKQDTGWQPEIKLEQTIKDLISSI